MLHVYLGRFAPFHEGHKILLTKLIKKFGVENCLVLIGSSNILNERTPFTFESRKKMIQKHFPDVRILAVADVNDDGEWLDNVEDMQKKTEPEFVFYGGSKDDLMILSRRFKTEVLVDRFTEGKGISATQIRKTLTSSDWSKASR
jgi:nicotinamide mononucleotide adenylyltransferase